MRRTPATVTAEISEDYENLVALLAESDGMPSRVRTLQRCLVRLHSERCALGIELPQRSAVDPVKPDAGLRNIGDHAVHRTVRATDAGMAKAPDRPKADDFRTAAERESDRKLVGTWWRCQRHGLVASPLMMAGYAFCPMEICDKKLLVVSSGRTAKQVERRAASTQPRSRQNRPPNAA